MRQYIDVVRGLKANTGGMYGPRSALQTNKKAKYWSTLEKISTALVITNNRGSTSFVSLKEMKQFGFVKKQQLGKKQMAFLWKKKNPVLFFKKDKIVHKSQFEKNFKSVFMRKIR